VTTKTIQARRLTTRHRLVTEPGELRPRRQALRLVEVAVDHERVEARAIHAGGFVLRTFKPADRVRVQA
jgi:hypothetical protein